MCMRHEVSPAVRTSAPDPRTSSTLSRPIATDVSAFLTANVPPNPQQASDRGRSTRVRPSTAASSRVGRSPTPSSRVEWQVGWNATVCGNRAPTSVTPRTSTRNSLSSRTRGATAATRSDSAASIAPLRRQLRDERVVATDHRGARPRRRDDHVVAGERVGEPLDERDAGVLVAGVEVHLAAAGLLGRELDLVAQPPQQAHDRPPDLRVQQVVVAGDEQRDAHVAQASARASDVAGLVAADVLGRPDQRAQGLEVAGHEPAGPGLDEDVAERRRLDRPGQHRDLARVGGELAEQRVSGAAADEVDDLDGPTRQPRRVTDGSGVGGGEAVEDAPDEPGARSGAGWSCCAAGRGDPGRHVARRQERRVVRIDDRPAGRQLARPRSGGSAGARACPRAPTSGATPGAATGPSRCAGTGSGRRRRPRW